MKHLILLIGISFIVACSSSAGVKSTPDTATAQPIPVSAAPPQYPREALMRGTSGWVRFGFHIKGDGTVTDIRVVESEPGRLFVASAQRALERWRFDPADTGPATYTIQFEVGLGDNSH